MNRTHGSPLIVSNTAGTITGEIVQHDSVVRSYRIRDAHGRHHTIRAADIMIVDDRAPIAGVRRMRQEPKCTCGRY